MPLNPSILANALVAAYTKTVKVSEIDPATGKSKPKTLVIAPEKATMETLATQILTHIQTMGTVLPGIPVVTPVGPGSTSGPGVIS